MLRAILTRREGGAHVPIAIATDCGFLFQYLFDLVILGRFSAYVR